MSCLIGRSLACDIDPPCQVQLAPNGSNLPDHVCHEMAWQTVSYFATRRPYPYPDDGFAYDVDYPLPLGKKRLKAARAEASKHKENAAAQGRQYPAMWLPSRSLVQSEGLLGLVVPRQVRLDGRTIGWVWLLGLVEVAPPLLQAELESAHAELDNSNISTRLGTNRMGFTRAITIPQGQETETVQSVEYKRMAAAAARVSELRARQEAARQKAEDSQPGTRSVIPTYEQSTYRYVAPLTQVEVLDWGERSAVLKVAGELHRWYKRHILGTKAWPGRREGSILLPNFPQLYPEMYRQLCSEMCKMAELPRALDVAAALGISEATFYNYLVRFHMAFPPDS